MNSPGDNEGAFIWLSFSKSKFMPELMGSFACRRDARYILIAIANRIYMAHYVLWLWPTAKKGKSHWSYPRTTYIFKTSVTLWYLEHNSCILWVLFLWAGTSGTQAGYEYNKMQTFHHISSYRKSKRKWCRIQLLHDYKS